MPPLTGQTINLRLGSRGSALALWQARTAQQLLCSHYPHLNTEIVTIKTSGDRDLTTPLSSLPHTGYFTKELEAALLDKKIDIAVHSLKDVAARTPAPFALAAILPRGPARDALVLHPRYHSLADLPEIPVILTGSPRRARQLQAIFPQCRTNAVRGNIATRLKKIETEGADALVVAEAALKRLEIEGHPVEILPIEKMIPAPGQGAVALEVLAQREDLLAHLAPIQCEATRRATDMERQLAYLLEGGCSLPLGAHACESDGELVFWTTYCLDDLTPPQVERIVVSPETPVLDAAETMAARFRPESAT